MEVNKLPHSLYCVVQFLLAIKTDMEISLSSDLYRQSLSFSLNGGQVIVLMYMDPGKEDGAKM